MRSFLERFGTESHCREALEAMRWPAGFHCPGCGKHGTPLRFERRRQLYLECRECGHQTSLVAGTLFQATKLSLRHWFLALHLLASAKTNVSALELSRQLDVCYRTAWRLKHKVMQAMALQEEARKLKGLVQIDDAYLGGERNGGKPGRGSENKQAFLIAVETDANLEHPRCAVIEPLKAFDNVSINDWAKRRLDPDAEVYTDGLMVFRRFSDAGHAHTVLESGGRRAATQSKGARWVNIVLANVKRSISGVYHSLKQQKYARRYLAEAAFRFNRRFHLKGILTNLLQALVNVVPHPEPRLRSASNYAN
jgi:Zn ribbon nucleic-acid-binding protein